MLNVVVSFPHMPFLQLRIPFWPFPTICSNFSPSLPTFRLLLLFSTPLSFMVCYTEVREQSSHSWKKGKRRVGARGEERPGFIQLQSSTVSVLNPMKNLMIMIIIVIIIIKVECLLMGFIWVFKILIFQIFFSGILCLNSCLLQHTDKLAAESLEIRFCSAFHVSLVKLLTTSLIYDIQTPNYISLLSEEATNTHCFYLRNIS